MSRSESRAEYFFSRTQALSVLLDIHFVSSTATAAHIDPEQHLSSLKLECSEELQARCSGYVEAEIERYSERLAQELEAEEEDADEDEEQENTSGSDTEMEESAKKRKKKAKGKKAVKGKKAAPKKQEQRKKKTPAAVRSKLASHSGAS